MPEACALRTQLLIFCEETIARGQERACEISIRKHASEKHAKADDAYDHIFEEGQQALLYLDTVLFHVVLDVLSSVSFAAIAQKNMMSSWRLCPVSRCSIEGQGRLTAFMSFLPVGLAGSAGHGASHEKGADPGLYVPPLAFSLLPGDSAFAGL